MPHQYQLNDPYDLDIMRAEYDRYSEKDWQEYIYFTQQEENKNAFSYDERGCLMRMAKKAGQYYRPADKDILWGLRLVDKIEKMKNKTSTSEAVAQSLKQTGNSKTCRNVTFRVAWHDNKWNGTICNHPDKNRFCTGFHSLLSERLRIDKANNMEMELAYQGKPASEKYFPPCYWSVNIFGKNNIPVEHYNPADHDLKNIKEALPANSMFSWPFATSFTRTNEQVASDGAYPKNLEDVRIPKFNSKIHENKSIVFMYAKFSNPLTEEEQQYLVVGCGLITGKGDPTYFGPLSVIEDKRKSHPKYRYFPSMNWALRYSFQNENLLVRMPYHEYIDHVSQSGINEDVRQRFLDKIKVAITEPELEHCFKYVAMDIDDDEAIFILSKMRQRLMECKDDGIVSVKEMQEKISSVEEMLGLCWKKRTYFPGFSSICRELLNWDKEDFPLDNLLMELQEIDQENYAETFISLMNNPSAVRELKKYESLLFDVKEKYEDSYGLSTEQFLNLCMLNLKPFQYHRVLKGKLKLSGDWKKTIEDEKASHEIDRICNNPYLLFEDYVPYETRLDSVTGEDTDAGIDLFKIDIAYFPDVRLGINRLSLQRGMRNNDKRRLRAVLIRYLRTLESTGHCFADAEEVEEGVKQYPLFYNMGTEYQLPPKFFERLSNEYELHFEEGEKKIKVVSENGTKYYYLYDVFNAERFIEKVADTLLREGIENPNKEMHGDLERHLANSTKDLKAKLGVKFDQSLFSAERTKLYSNIYKNKFYVLAGNPGSGKSFELLNIIKDLKNQNQTCLLLTPTGKAALRLKTDDRFPDIEAFTIDKILADVKNEKISRSELQQYNNIIIDEMSMVDLMKLKTLLSLFNFNQPSFKRLILVGDPHQLPAIGYGKVLKDVLYYLNTHSDFNNNCIELQTNCRQELAENRILEFSEGFIKDGEISEELKAKIFSDAEQISKGFRVLFWENEGDLYKLLDKEFDLLCDSLQITGSKSEKLNLLFKLKKDGSLPKDQSYNLEHFQMLTPYKSDFFGAGQINDYVQSEYRKESKLCLLDDWFKESEKIIRTKNYYEKGKLILSNGSIGIIRKEKVETLYFRELLEPMPVYGDKGIRSSEQEYFDLAYAITVHKSQGSGFNHVFFVLPKKSGLLCKELIYTACNYEANLTFEE